MTVAIRFLPMSEPAVADPAPPPEDDLGAVFVRARAGDGAAFAELYRRFARAVHGIVLSRAGPSDAEDLVQEVFASVHRALATVRDARALPAWIRSVAVHAAVDRLRRRGKGPRRVALVDGPARPDGDGAAERELRERVLARLLELPEANREPLVLRLVEGLDGPEIARLTGMTPGSVRVNLCRGLALLRPLLEKDGLR